MRTVLKATVGLALVASVLAPVVGAAPAAGKTVARIEVKGGPTGGNPTGGGGLFTLQAGKVSDRGRTSYAWSGAVGTISLMGKRGDLTLRLKRMRTPVEFDSEGLDLWVGTWATVTGTGAYAGMKGGGGFLGLVGPQYKVDFTLQGFFAKPLTS